ncbi:MAG: hypothetical protein AAF438_23350, partial [Pseudomonadota bacterium]
QIVSKVQESRKLGHGNRVYNRATMANIRSTGPQMISAFWRRFAAWNRADGEQLAAAHSAARYRFRWPLVL